MSYGILSTYPPTQCGLATFSHALVESLRSAVDVVGVVQVMDDATDASAAADHHWVRTSSGGAQAAAAALNSYDIAIVQHEYGIFPGRDGDEVLTVLRGLQVPTIVVLHTVLTTPTRHQREILEELVARSSLVVTMTRTARQRLIDHYTVDATRIRVIPHGAADTRAAAGTRPQVLPDRSPMILTWGLLGEGKGIEWAIDAMPAVADLRPRPRYWVVGQTHPKVKAQHGESYRDGLIRRAARGPGGLVHFDDRYLDTGDLHRLVQRADIVLLPYDSREQVTSGVLIEAVTAGKPVISTGFPHAVELLSSGAGLIVARQDPVGIGAALRRILTEPGLAAGMSAEANRIAPDLLWPAVAERYRKVAAAILRPDALLATA